MSHETQRNIFKMIADEIDSLEEKELDSLLDRRLDNSELNSQVSEIFGNFAKMQKRQK